MNAKELYIINKLAKNRFVCDLDYKAKIEGDETVKEKLYKIKDEEVKKMTYKGYHKVGQYIDTPFYANLYESECGEFTFHSPKKDEVKDEEYLGDLRDKKLGKKSHSDKLTYNETKEIFLKLVSELGFFDRFYNNEKIYIFMALVGEEASIEFYSDIFYMFDFRVTKSITEEEAKELRDKGMQTVIEKKLI